MPICSCSSAKRYENTWAISRKTEGWAPSGPNLLNGDDTEVIPPRTESVASNGGSYSYRTTIPPRLVEAIRVPLASPGTTSARGASTIVTCAPSPTIS
jgi:hypothetical protein